MPLTPDRTTAITVAEALALPALQRGLPEVLAGHEALSRPIRWVHAGEVPNIATLLVGGELLLTTGMGIAPRPAQQRAFVGELAERGVVALVIELGSSLEVIPEALREAATQVGLPLIALHREVPFVRVTEAIHTELVNRQYGLLREGEQIKDRLIGVMLEGDGLPELLQTLSGMLGNPVFLESARGRMLFHAGGGDDLEAFESAGARAGLEAPVPMGPGSQPGRLVVLPTRRAPTELDQVALRHAAGIVALALLRAREEDELLARERGNLLVELAEGMSSGVQAARQAEGMGFRPQGSQLLAIAVVEVPPSPGQVRAALLGDLQRELEGRATPILCGGRPGDEPLLALTALPGRSGAARRPGGAAERAARGDRTAAARGVVADRVAEVVARVWERRRPGTRTIVGIDGPVGWDGAGPALRVAAQTATAARRLPERSWYDARATELERLLAAVGDERILVEFVQRNLGPLLDHDREHKLALLGTLQALCAHGGHKASAARDLHLHRQALYHRIARIEALLGVDLSDAAQLTTLDVALRALPYLGDQRPEMISARR
ncbi:MAG TPA: PucR family transcriptional regulator [Solirubrobacteraceae bacterium]|nr:PucR family transcriptional regulator [Solirubrobacteraceae bacterium]